MNDRSYERLLREIKRKEASRERDREKARKSGKELKMSSGLCCLAFILRILS